MKLSNGQIFNIVEQLSSMRQATLPIKLSFIIAKNLIILEPYYKIIIEFRNNILINNGYDGSPDFRFNEEQTKQINKELYEFQSIENEIVINKIPLSLLLETDTNVTPSEIETLYPIISEEE